MDRSILDEAVRERLIAMMVEFSGLLADPNAPEGERKRLLAHLIEGVTRIEMPEGTTRSHVCFKCEKNQNAHSPKASAQQENTPSGIVELVDKRLDRRMDSEIVELLNEQGYCPGGSARRGPPRCPLQSVADGRNHSWVIRRSLNGRWRTFFLVQTNGSALSL